MKPQRTSYAFLMEMLWVCAFFLISACIFVLSFAKAEHLSREAETLNQAVQAVSNAMEDTMAGYYSPEAAVAGNPGPEAAISGNPGPEAAVAGNPGPGAAISGSPGPEAAISGNPGPYPGAAYGAGDFTLTIETSLENSILTAAIEAVSTRDGSVIYRLEGSRFLPEGEGDTAGEGATGQ